jgi:hypothetical protein
LEPKAQPASSALANGGTRFAIRAGIAPPASPATRSIEEIREIFDEVRKDIWAAVEQCKLQLPIDRVFAFDNTTRDRNTRVLVSWLAQAAEETSRGVLNGLTS